MRLSILAVLLASAAASLPAQQASFSTFGSACASPLSPSVPSIGARGTPQLGSTFTVTYSGPNQHEPGIVAIEQPMLIVSPVRIDFAVPPILPLQPPGCTLYPAPDIVIPMPLTAGGMSFATRLPVPIPNLPVLVGANVYLQWMTPRFQCMFVGCDFLYVQFSEGGLATLGR